MDQRKIRRYSELLTMKTFDERFEYLRVNGLVGADKFGSMRLFNQDFYHSTEWKKIRRNVIVRDNGCDLGIPGHEIVGRIIIHHLNPLTLEDIRDCTDYLLNPEYLICVSNDTHQALHYSNEIIQTGPVIRTPHDTCPWKGANNG